MATAADYDALRKDVGATITSLPDPEAQAIFDQAAVFFTDPACQTAYTRVIAIRQLAAQAATLTDYTQNNSRETMSKIFDNYLKLLELWTKSLDAAIALQGAGGARFGQTKRKPARVEEYPGGVESPWWMPSGYGRL